MTSQTNATRRARQVIRLAWLAFATLVLVAVAPTLSPTTAQAPGPCEPPNGNPIKCENQLTGNLPSEWDIDGWGDDSIQGFATDISVNKGQTVSFKIDTDATAYRLDIYRMGYYGGRGARKVATVLPSATLPQNQPDCLDDEATGLIDCGNWSVSATWAVPSTAVSGIYFAKAVRPDTAGASHIVFIVRDDTGSSDLLFQTSDTTWQAYNQWGGNSLYVGGPGTDPGRAYKVSYNRPFTTRGTSPEDWVFNAEYPMVRFLEANGYNVSYTTGVDTDRRGAELLEHKAFLSVGHDEYWSGAQRTAVETARAGGVNLAFFSGNEVFWKTRWETSIAPGGATYRTLVSYKETHAGAKIDPSSQWTGTFADPRFSPPSDGNRPQNALTGQYFTVNCCTYAMEVPAAEGKHRFWRNTSIAALQNGEVAALPDGTLGYEWDEDVDNGFRPAGLARLSDTVVSGVQHLTDWGSSYESSVARHSLTYYRHSSGAKVFGAGTVQWSWGLDGNHDRGPSDTSLDMQQATVNLFADMKSQPTTLQPGLVAATASDDTVAPTSTIVLPIAGSTVQQNSAVTVSGTATDGGGGRVAGVEVSLDNGVTWRRASGTASWTYTWMTGGAGSATLRSRAVDDSGNLGVASTAVSVTIGNVPLNCPCSIWTPSQTPTNAAEPDAHAVELGLKFRTTIDGYISGVRFYKSVDNTGTHTGSLWTSGGSLLETATFSGETASGWQQVTFANPVQVDANATYVVSYHTNAGFYAQDYNYFSTAGVQNGPLRALADDDDGVNGVFKPGSVGGFPTVGFQASNYWVDVVFVTSAGPDTTPPTITNRVPAAGASGASVTAPIKVTLSERMTASTINGNTFQLRGPGNVLVSSVVSWDINTRTATLDPNATLAYNTDYTATVVGGSSGMKDLAGNALAGNSVWTFTTSAPPPPPPTQGPGGPVLVVTTTSNRFTQYYAEILRAEGLNSFAVADIGSVNSTVLAGYDVVLLGEVSLSSTQASMFSTWVTGGGNLIAMRPDKDLASLLGLTDAGTTLAEGYLLINTASSPGAGLVNQTIQYHGTADRYTLSGATAVATLYSSATGATSNPAVTVRSVGSNGGTAAAFTFDLARSVVYTRQGNPAWAGQERDGVTPIRSNDLFFGGSQANWIDMNKVAIPQADEQQRLLANLVNFVNADRKPLPRFWYFPNGYKAAIVMTGDDHGLNGTTGQFDWFKGVSPANCSVLDWQCVRSTSYIYPNTPISNAQAASYTADGFEIGVHITTNCSDWTPASLDQVYTNDLENFAANFPAVSSVVTNRTHCIVWSDYATQPEVALAHGIRLDTNYYYWPASWINDKPGLFTGSGMPMRFATADGTMIDVYQATTQMTDESGQTFPFNSDTLLDRALGAEGYYGAFVANMHTDHPDHPSAFAIIGSAQQRGVPVISAAQLLTWLDGRNASSFQNLTWTTNRLTFTINVGSGAHGLQAMLPADSPAGPLSTLRLGGSPVPYTLKTIKGLSYAVFTASAGAYEAQYAPDTVPPVITGISATTTPSTATVSWTTSETSTSVVNYGTSAGSLNQVASAPGLSLTHQVTISGLAEGTTYFFRVTSVDSSGNSASAPSTPTSFTTLAFAVGDTTVAHFSAGTPDANLFVTQSVDGEIMLRPTVVAEFDGTALPAGWNVTPWTTGGGATIAGGSATVNGAMIGTDAQFSGPSSLEFVATFNSAQNQHVGLGVTLGESLWAIFSTGSGGTLYARTNNGSAIDTLLGGSWLGTPHRYRIDRNASSVVYSIDGTVVATHNVGLSGSVRPLASDLATTDGALVVDWIRMLPYASTSTFTSRVLDGTTSRTWRSMNWTADVPAGTTVAMSVRFGNTATPDGTWTAFQQVAYAGGSVSATSRYAQYRAVLTGNGTLTPIVMDVSVTIAAPAPDTVSPVVTDVTATPAATSAVITWTTNEAATSVVNYGTSAGSLTQTASVAGLSTGHTVTLNALLEGTTYYYRVTSADAAGNSTATPSTPGSFATSISPTVALTDTLRADFAAGSGDVYFGQSDDGEVLLTPAVAQELEGTTLPASWASTAWNTGGGGIVAGGSMTIDGGRIDMGPLAPAGQVFEFTGSFSGAAFDHAGFGVTLNEPLWAMFSTGAGNALLARTHNGFSAIDTALDSGLLNGTHRFRVEWTPTTAVFSVDGTVVATHSHVIEGNMRPLASDFNIGDGTLRIDSMRMAPFATSGTFVSRVLNAGTVQNWNNLAWTGSVPAGSTLGMAIRLGNTPTPDASWTTFTTVASSGALVTGSSRYAQYRATLTGNGVQTPELASVTLSAQAPPPQINISDATVAEGNSGVASLSFTVSLSRSSAQTVTVNYATANGTATAGSDYTAGTGTVTFAAGEMAKTISIPVAGDTMFESDETLQVTLSAPQQGTLGRSQGLGTITNDDAQSTISIADGSVTEGNSGTRSASLVVTLSNPSSQTITVAYATANGTATAGSDYTAASGTLTFTSGTVQQTVNVTVQGDNTLEADETFTVTLSNPSNATIADGTGTGTIVNDEPVPTLSIANTSVTEGNFGSTTMTFTVTMTPANPAQTVTVQYATANGTATAGQDYTAASGTLTFSTGSTSRTFSVTVQGDNLDEANETLTATLSNPVNAVLGTAVATGTINDNDPTPELSVNNVTVTEGNTGSVNANFTVSLSDDSGQTVTVNYATANGTATAGSDYTALSGTLTFAPGETSKTVSVAVLGDTLDEANETFTLVLSGQVNATIDDGSGTGTITDNDPTPSMSIANVTVTEGDSGSVMANFVVTLTAASGQNVTVNYSTSSGSATAGVDYTTTSGTLTIPQGSATATIAVPVLGDLIDEPNETFTVNLSSANGATISDSSATGTITDNDPISLQVNDVTVTEGNSGTITATFTVSLSASSAQTVTVNYATANGTATAGQDYTATSGSLSFTGGATTRTVNVSVIGDTLDEANEAFELNLSGAVNANIGDSQGIGTINDNDPTPSLAINNVTVTEGNSGSTNAGFVVSLSAASGQVVTLNYATANNSAGSSDFTATSGTLTFAPGEASKAVNVAVLGDTVDEANETFNVNLSGAVNATISDSQGVGTINDDDPAPTLAINDVAATEGNSGTKTFTFTVTLSAVSGQTVEVDYQTANGTATAGTFSGDYTAENGTVTFAAGQTSQSITISVRGDNTRESNETFFVNLSGASGATIADSQGVGTITNDD